MRGDDLAPRPARVTTSLARRRRRLVVIGNGMAAIRLVEELVRRGRTTDDHGWEVTVIGDEPGPAYNRILLSAVLEGSHPQHAIELRSRTWYADAGVTLRTDTRVARIDREGPAVVLQGGERLDVDRVVLATGSTPVLPPIRGLVELDADGRRRLDARVHTFRTTADTDRLITALPSLRRIVVVGGGLLGLQVATALVTRGIEVDLIEGSPHLLSRHLGPAAGAVLRRTVTQLGIEVHTEVRASRLEPGGVRLDNGYLVPLGALVLATGTRPSVSVALASGLFVRRGVVVDSTLTSLSDGRIHALGDCAEFRGATPGFVAPAWDQAAILASRLCGEDVDHAGTRIVARLRATGLEVAVFGEPEKEVGQVVEMANPVRGIYRKLVVRDGVIRAGVCVGDLTDVGLITALFDRQSVLGPDEPAQLVRGVRTAAPPPISDLPDDVEVCTCAGVDAGRIRACSSLAEVKASTRATTGCGGCSRVCEELVGTRRPVHSCETQFSRP